ncbi:hypothetical protein G4228_006362 [Cervus hanglu yarkandensis]|nr:hypothetical protein G4228_006362 [Cervus hanglu yarkandensis]
MPWSVPGQPYCDRTALSSTEGPLQGSVTQEDEAMSNKACRYFDEGRGSCPFGRNYFYKRAYPDGCREEPQNRKWEHQADTRSSEGTTSGSSSRHQRTATLLTTKIVTFELGEMLFMLLAAGGDDDLADAEDEWDLFHDELEDFYDLDL